jgi:hypothetical protein
VSLFDTDILLSLQTQGAFPDFIANVVLSSDDDDVVCQPEPDVSIDWKISVVNDTGDVRTTSAEAIILGQIRVSASGNPRSPIADLVSVVLPARGRRRKRPPIGMTRCNPIPPAD